MSEGIDQVLYLIRKHRIPFYILISILIFVSYFFTAKGGLSLNAVSGFATLVWPPTGIALVAILIFGFRFWPAIFFAALFINFLTGAELPIALGIATGNTLEAVVGAFLLRRSGFHMEMERIKDVLLFLLFGVVVNTFISASIGVSSLWLGDVIAFSDYPSTWIAWWVGDMLGALIIGNLLLNIHKTILWKEETRPRLPEVLAFIILLSAFCMVVFLNPGAINNPPKETINALVYLTPLFLLWSALRMGSMGSAFAIFGVSAVAIFGTVLGTGPFTGGTLSHDLLQLQIFMGSIVVSKMVLAVAIKDSASKTRTQRLPLSDLEILLNGRRRDVPLKKPRNLPVVAELFSILFVFLVIIGILLSLNYFGMQTLSSIRAYVGGEGLWSKAEKDAVYRLRIYAVSGDENDFVRYRELIKVPLGDKKARLELEKPDANFDYAAQGFIEGNNSPEDTRGMSLLFRRFRHVSYMERAIAIWTKGDEQIAQLMLAADTLHTQVSSGTATEDEVNTTLMKIDKLNEALTVLEDDFSAILGEAARWITKVLILAMLLIAALLLLPSVAISLFIIRNIGRLDRAKTEFISLTSHQLRTPPTGIKWYAGMLLDGDLGEMTPEQRKYLEQIAYNNQRMIDVVDSVLDISQIELGVFQNEPKSADVCVLIEKILTELDFQLTDKDLKLSRRFECGPQPILIDPTLVRIVIQNLLLNAVKYTPRGGEIAFAANISGQKLTLTIADTGQGIPKEDFPNIFTKFFRASNAQDSEHSGTGLGLYIVKHILDQIGGTIAFSSELGKGTTFFVTIPIKLQNTNRA